MTFKAKKDLWIAVVVAGAAIALLGAGADLVNRGGPHIIGGLLSLPIAAGMWWLFAGVRYELTGAELKITCGPFVTRVPIDAIVAVTPTRNPVSAPAPSLDRLQIDYTKGGDSAFVLVSPADKRGFIIALADHADGLSVVADRVVRR